MSVFWRCCNTEGVDFSCLPLCQSKDKRVIGIALEVILLAAVTYFLWTSSLGFEAKCIGSTTLFGIGALLTALIWKYTGTAAIPDENEVKSLNSKVVTEKSLRKENLHLFDSQEEKPSARTAPFQLPFAYSSGSWDEEVNEMNQKEETFFFTRPSMLLNLPRNSIFTNGQKLSVTRIMDGKTKIDIPRIPRPVWKINASL